MTTVVTLAAGDKPVQFYAKESPGCIESKLRIAAANNYPGIELRFIGQPRDRIEYAPKPITIGVRYFISAAERRD